MFAHRDLNMNLYKQRNDYILIVHHKGLWYGDPQFLFVKFHPWFIKTTSFVDVQKK